ncbi:ectoine synthase [Desmospora profundinema]|uniref:L-ectoine synthase n=1 Tax=Desmospora profundinema TaxID=1571184 RepID=A0ABU1IKU4_9BACL|nr:ectoine synthase [Desmospora profundinema]MDR6225172.1 L-ectoine synthase [Desmospora profundinema]
MIVRYLDEIVGTDGEVSGETWISRRLLLKKDGCGFSLHDTIIKAGTVTNMWYKNHIEAVYCIEGEGEVETVDDGKVYPLKAGSLYTLDGHEKHQLRAKTQMRMICVFNPPVSGNETHDKDGAYPLVD